MKYMFLLIVTFKIIKKKFTKLNEIMRFQRSLSSTPQVQAITKAKEDEIGRSGGGGGGDSLSLRALSRRHYRTNKNMSTNYDSWLVKHPSALGSFDRIIKAAKGKRIIIFLDYDGTLSPIVDDPNCAFMSDEMRAAVCEVARFFPTAIISGRSRDKVKEFVKLSNVYYAGSHGMDIMVPAMPVKTCDGNLRNIVLNKKKNEIIFQPAKKFLPAIREIFASLKDKTKEIQGARLEDNGFCISVHFRHVREEDYSLLEEKVKSVLENHSEFCLTGGRKVMEIRPSIEWNKGHAVEYFLDILGLSDSSNVLPLCIGDDRTDEDAFKVIQNRGQGYPIIVSSIPKDTKAGYSLRDPSEVLTLLQRLARWRKACLSNRRLNQV
ncbi:Trehalose 6-phosphate phosphatase [Quillaja saponaria]|uniref:Trehalose 6-phosphate phosphatase n=1 Tax=Quillaja saponaria TaxID=32244 RepID=A0AAD7LJH6_QUISA|nr:Trehalose 6-phosphate phosphatase [Quillaja saponaria]